MRSARVSRRTRTNRTYSLLGTCGLLAITVIHVPEAADLLHQLRARRAVHSGLLTGASAPQRSAELDEQLAQLNQELQHYERAMIGVEEIPALQSELMELARESQCKLRKSVSQSGASHSWTQQREGDSNEEEEYDSEESPYKLVTAQLNLSWEGTLEQTFDFLSRVRAQDRLMKFSQISFARSPDGSGRLSVEVNLSFYKLTRTQLSEEEFIQWREGSRPGELH